eukprot:CAMPEP_0197175014 /NCGR_PEP_ID=MMETSP1423-20130617/1344_1 /TAXON_ID=476441 /ORGANISM="Pseudo-nitzschia heimii, Strain UNC1101" /LENGTH=429 /DNA_ID=CAMNT_0042624053 /DNA_START=179 /DNA_END=1468 /DNA_ORIENTATION=-
MSSSSSTAATKPAASLYRVASTIALTTVAALASSSMESVEGFTAPNPTRVVGAIRSSADHRRIASPATFLRMASDAKSEVEMLREMAAKARKEAAALAKELGYEDEDLGTANSAAEAAAAKKASRSPEEVAAAIRAIDFTAGAPETQIAALDDLRGEGSLSLYKSATVEAGSGDLRSYPVSLSMLEQRAGLTSEKLGIGEEEVSLDDFKYGTLWVTGGCTVGGIASLAFLPQNVGATLCYFLALIPILWLGVGSTVPALIANLILLVKGEDDGGVDADERVCRHEAAHFLAGYLCGLPVADYATAKDSDVPRVEFHYSSDPNAVATAASRELTMDEVNALTVVALSGAVAEAMAYDKAKGGNADLIELQNVFAKSQEFLGAAKQQDMTRWGALTAYRLLAGNKARLDELAEAFSRKRSIADCVAIIERE